MPVMWLTTNRHTPTGGVATTDHEVDREDHSEMNEIDVHDLEHRQEDRHQQNQRDAGLHDGPEKEQDDIQHKEHYVFAGSDRGEPVDDRFRYVTQDEQVGKDAGVGDDERDHGGGHHGFHQDSRQVPEPDAAINQHRDGQRVYRRHRGGLGGSENAADDAPDDDDRGQPGDKSVPEAANKNCKGDPRVLGEIFPLSDDGNHDHQR